MKKTNIILLIISFIAIIAIAMYSSGKNQGHPSEKKEVKNVAAPTDEIPENTVIISNYKYYPEKITVKKGTTITWINKDIAKHTVTDDKDPTKGPNSDYYGKDKSYTFTFNEVGDFPYHCEPHPYMKGQVVVTE